MQNAQTIEREQRNAANHAANVINSLQPCGYQLINTARMHDHIAILMRDVTQQPPEKLHIKIALP